MPRNNSSTLTRSTPRAARAALAAHALDSTTYHNGRDDEHGAGWSARCTCGATSGNTRYPTRDDAVAAHAGHVRRYLPAGTR